MTIPEEVDVIVCGGGSSGCCVAGRLANLDPNLKVLLIEAGENNLNNPWVYRPGIYPVNMKLDSRTASFYRSKPSKHLNGRSAIVPQAHVLGGGSSINFMMYTRASASDYDDWQAEGWKTKDLLPLMKKHETYQRPCNNPDLHGFKGPIKVSFGNHVYPMAQDFLRAVDSQGIPITDDLQDLSTGHGAEMWLKWINRDSGRRSDSAHAYIHSTMRNQDNLYLLCNTKVDKVKIKDGRAVAVETVPTKYKLNGKPPRKTFSARKQIILNCGTVGSPLVLERSGVGDPARLRDAGVKCIVDLPGVGTNFQDHYLTFAAYRAKPDTETFDDFLRGDKETQKKVIEQWNANGTGPLATNGIDAGVKLRPTPDELETMGEAFKQGWKDYFEDKPDKPVMHYSIISGFFGDHNMIPPGKYFTMFHFLEYPFSRGYVHIKSDNPYDAPEFDPGFMNDERDMAPMVWAYKKSRETARRMDCYAGEVTSHHPRFPCDSEARAFDMDLETTKAYGGKDHLTAGLQHGSWTAPLEKPEPRNELHVSSNQCEKHKDLNYSEEDEQAIADWVREHVETTWHCLGTCSMAPREGSTIARWGGVVDERLNVHGVKGLKVADLSICPDNVGCNTYSTALLIAEKSAVITAEDLGYSGEALNMIVPTFHTGTYEKTGVARL
ncbi:hypothetical protein TRICI_000495 [Trichomonascus ciferrii]|uniref:alcohol oxidase n=1 Tax=Trichomonascus ciferrii TaxID=44093 RepID=A0A642VDA0_9ASCO|nr:hypothetical protein TRICI_000495 [Trichomonascus ciferrii]